MTHQIVTKLWNLAEAAKTATAHEVASLEPKLRAAARDVEDAAEHFHSALDNWIALHFTPAAEEAKVTALAAYHAALRSAHDLYNEAKANF